AVEEPIRPDGDPVRAQGELPLAPRAEEVALPVVDDDRMITPADQVDAVLTVDRDARDVPVSVTGGKLLPALGGPGAQRHRISSFRSGPLVSEALDLVHVRAFDADQPRRPIAPRGVQIALVVDVGHPWLERVARREANLARLVRCGLRDERPVAHHGLAPRLPVDRPGRTVIVRIALLLALVRVGEDTEAELRILVEDLALGHVVSDVPGDERVVLEDLLHDLAHLLPA